MGQTAHSPVKSRIRGDRPVPVKQILILALTSWTLIIAALSFWSIRDLRQQGTRILLSQARSYFSIIVTTRYWNSLHGGVYVPVTEKTRPNPYLEVPDRDLETKRGLLTLINPAFMTRQISEIAGQKDKVNFHITSLKPLNPKNAPAAWERKALSSFRSDRDEHYLWTENRDFFKYMAPLWTTRPCLKCHEKQGYTEGDLRGGISVTIPAKEILDTLQKYAGHRLTVFLLIWLVGALGILLSFLIINDETARREILIDELKTALDEVKTLEGLIPICSSCKKIRDDRGYWNQVEKYIVERSDAEFTHSLCPECVKKILEQDNQDE